MRASGEETSRNLRAYPRRSPRRDMKKKNTSLISNRGKTALLLFLFVEFSSVYFD